jgi:L,D-transpeptidase ErfK/SrfK
LKSDREGSILRGTGIVTAFCGHWILFFIVLFGLALPQSAQAAEVQFNQGFGGEIRQIVITPDDSLIELARAFDIGYNEIMAANAGVDPFLPDEGTPVTIPTAWILPDIPTQARIIINLPEMRLYYFHPRDANRVETFPVGIGDVGWATPTGNYRIIEKIENPAWNVPESIRRQKPELPKIVPPGPDNPLGSHALRLSIGTVLIHGTDRPFGIGRRVSHGCLHLYPEDIPTLFRKVKVGARVIIVHQPVKATLADGRVLVEVHGSGKGNLLPQALDLIKRKELLDMVDVRKLRTALRANSGIPTDVTKAEDIATSWQ